MKMATFDPPRNHWDADFDARLNGSFAWLREQVEVLGRRVAALEADKQANDERLAQAVADAKYWAQQAGDNR